jgi:hypothetical protein
MDQTPLIAPDLIWRLLDDNAVVVSPQVGDVHVFSQTGSTIWQLLAKQKNLNEIEEYLVNHYIVNREEARRDMESFIYQLQELGLLV